jgi:peptide/nickel transport system permease protein
MWHLMQGDFGKSFNYRRPAMEVTLERLPATIELGTVCMVIALLIALPVGTYAAVKRGGWFDAIGRAFAFMGQAAPTFWTGIMAILLFAVTLGWLPVGGRGSPVSIILPALTLGWGICAGMLRLTRSSMLDVLANDYMILARVKGLSRIVVIWKHGFKNAAIPVLTYAILLLMLAIGGAVITETVYAWPGVGRLMMNAVLNRDFPVVQAVVIVLSISLITLNLIADILYAYLNPRIRYKS